MKNFRLSEEQIKGLDKKLEWILEVENKKICEIYFHSAIKKIFKKRFLNLQFFVYLDFEGVKKI